ncbi:ABC transporter substrate-binding protein [Alsobacter sp. KACC 23698]|uniref:ABC transporter substrate-binding protein n=1 Tax=Alsobacter sp. KACC 23698 TaxID=3149229 RepID=A0AAU7JJB2_9HYPH
MRTITKRTFSLTSTGLAAVLILTATPSLSQEVYRIGALNPVTGAGSTYGSGMQKSILAAAAEVNAAGGPAGRRLEVLADDSQTAPEPAVLAAKKLIEVNKVGAILGTWSSSVSLAIQPLTQSSNVILMHTSSAPALFAQNQRLLSWGFQSGSKYNGQAMAAAVAKEGFKRPVIMAFNNDAATGNVGYFRTSWEATGGKVLASVVYEPRRTSYRSELQKALTQNPDVIVLSGYLPDTTIILREAYELGVTAKFLIPGWAAGPQLISALGPDASQDVLVYESVPDVEGAAFKRYSEAYNKALGATGEDNVFAAQSYDMVITLALAMEKAGASADNIAIARAVREVANPEGQKVSSFAEGQKALKAGQKINYEGASGRLDFDEDGNAVADFAVFTIDKGKYVKRYSLK